jgi:hypothetical protein
MLVKVKKQSIYRDGGTTTYIDKDGKRYFEDNRIGTSTKGDIYDRYPSDPESKKIDIQLVIVNDL